MQLGRLVEAIDWFVPEATRSERIELTVARNFVITQFAGSLLCQSISVSLYMTDPRPGFGCWTMIGCVSAFCLLPFVLKLRGDLALAATISVELLSFLALFGAYFYGGLSSPLLPWLLVSVLLAFFYLPNRPWRVAAMFAGNIGAFAVGFLAFGFPELAPASQMSTVGWISIVSALVYMSWMSIFYAKTMTMRSELDREGERQAATAIRLARAKEVADAGSLGRSNFLSRMSHEFRVPLDAVIGCCEFLLAGVDSSESGAETKRDLERIKAAGKHLLSVVTDVPDISEIEANNVELKCENFDLSSLVEDIAATCLPMVTAGQNRLVVECPADLGRATTDQTKLRQAALNLMSNAAKFTMGGTIVLTATRERRGSGDWIEIRVSDSGIGLSKAEMGRLFENYGQASSQTSSRYGGTGLGLAISRRFCVLMGGGITVTSEVGHGSVLSIRVPATLVGAAQPMIFPKGRGNASPALVSTH